MRQIRFAPLVFALLLAACSARNDGPNIANADGTPAKAGIYSLFDPNAGTIPFPFDGLFVAADGSLTGTINIPNPPPGQPGYAPFVADANRQDGFSTVASAFTDFIGFVDFATATPGILVIDGATGAPLTPGVDYLLQPSTAKDNATGVPINLERTRILIEPLKPLKPSTTYLVAVTVNVKSKDGVPVAASDAFKVVRSSVPVTGAANAQDTDTTNPNYAYVSHLTAAQKATLEALRSKLIYPLVAKLSAATHLPDSAFALAWSFTTESITDSLAAVNAGASAKQLALKDSQLDTSAVGATNSAEIFIGTLQGLPYYLTDDAHRTATDTPLTSYWKNNGAPSAGVFALTKSLPANQQVPCAAFSPAAPAVAGISRGQVDSTTACFPTPAVRSTQTIPVIATVPIAQDANHPAGCPGGMPANGWPVVIFQHGITGNRTQMLAIGPTLAHACMVTVAIDLPLHGLPPPKDMANLTPTDRIYLATGGIERTFNLDSAGRGPSMPGYTTAASSGTFFINLPSLITSRDNLRQAVADLSTLTKSVPNALFLNAAGNAPAGVTIDASKIYYVGHSLGGIVGGTLLGVNSDIKAATLAMPGGGVAKLLDASASFSPVISAGLAANGINKGTDLYETFLRFAQTLVDAGDPINYAAAASVGHPIHLIEVVGGATLADGSTALPDQVVPNNALAGTLASIPGYLSGTDPLVQVMGLTPAGTEPLTVPIAQQQPVTGAKLDVVTRFTQGNHGSILSPAGSAINAGVTCEMQRQTATFLATGGTVLPIGGTCP